MKFFKNNGDVHAYEIDGPQDDLIAAAREAGWHEMTDAEVAQFLAPPVVPPAKIMSVTPVQAYTALDKMGVLAQVMAFIDAPTTPPLVRLAWLGATEFRRDSLLVMNAAIVLGWSDAQLDALFEMAATL